MGQGAPKQGETHEVTIEVEGEVSTKTFKTYLDKLRACVDQLATLTDDTGKGSKPLRVRLVRTRIRRK